MSIATERYVLLTTFRKDGSPVSTPVWIAPLSGRDVCFTTSGDAGKVKRINRTPRVTLQPCDMRGRPTANSTPINGAARVVTGADFDAVEKAVAKKYGIQYRLVVWSGALTSVFKRTKTADAGIVITLD